MISMKELAGFIIVPATLAIGGLTLVKWVLPDTTAAEERELNTARTEAYRLKLENARLRTEAVVAEGKQRKAEADLARLLSMTGRPREFGTQDQVIVPPPGDLGIFLR